MPRLPQRRRGNQLKIKERPLPYSFWPVYQGSHRIGLQSSVFALDPWTIINSSIRRRCPAVAQKEAHACIEQAKDFYQASISAHIAAAKPLLLYYCFLNIVKAFALTVGQQTTYDKAEHGLGEGLTNPPGRELLDAYLSSFQSPNSRRKLQVFDEFYKALTTQGLSSDLRLTLPKLMPQILAGHRLWAAAAETEERFLAMHEIRMMVDERNKTVWINLYFFADDLARLDVTVRRLITESGLSGLFRQVTSDRKEAGRKLICLEQISVRSYRHRPSDIVGVLVRDIKYKLWTAVASVQPYRRYYLYLAPLSEHSEILPQLLSIYTIMYYLGSITRYRPHHFDSILIGTFGPRIEEFITGQPLQFIYLMASEFAQQDVVRPSIV